MKLPPSWHASSAASGALLGALVLLGLAAQSPSGSVRIPQESCRNTFSPPVPVARLEYFSVVNYAGRALAGDMIQVDSGERLVVLGKNPTAKGLGSIGSASAIKLPLIDETFAENLLGPLTSSLGLQYLQGGVPAVVLDEGTYVFAEYPGFEEPTPRQVHERALVGYRLRLGE